MNTEKKNILIVDDDVDYLSQLEYQLEREINKLLKL